MLNPIHRTTTKRATDVMKYQYERDDSIDWISETVCPLTLCVLMEAETLPGRDLSEGHQWGSSAFGFYHISVLELLRSELLRDRLSDSSPHLFGSLGGVSAFVAELMREGIAEREEIGLFKRFFKKRLSKKLPSLTELLSIENRTGFLCQAMRFFPEDRRAFSWDDASRSRAFFPCIFVQVQQRGGRPEEKLNALAQSVRLFFDKCGAKEGSWTGGREGRARFYSDIFKMESDNSTAALLAQECRLSVNEKSRRRRI